MPAEIMSSSGPSTVSASANDLTVAAYISFVPIGIATVLLGPLLPTLSARWSLNYAEAGALFTAQYIASTIAVALSGVVVSWRGYRFAMESGILLMSVGLALVLLGPKWLGILCIAVYGGGIGIAVPAANLMVAELNPARRAATLNWLNFYWSAGAVSCPFLVAVATKMHRLPLFLAVVSAFSLLVAVGIFRMPADLSASVSSNSGRITLLPLIRSKSRVFLIFAALFFIYVGTENGFGGWVASFAKSLGSLSPVMSLITPSFFYASLMLGRWLAPFLLRADTEVRLVRWGLLLACGGTAGLLWSHGLAGVLVSACAAGFGLSYVYPITIALLSKEFGGASSRIGSVMFVLSNIGGGLFPWIVGLVSNRTGTLKNGLLVPLFGCALMLILYLQQWDRPQLAASSAE
jgi:FHS family glucose/mannose:H+ symporter-like MFS transporter